MTGSRDGWWRSSRPGRRAARLIAASVALIAVLGACGQRGPLYLPDSRPGKKPAPSATRDATQPGAPSAPVTQES